MLTPYNANPEVQYTTAGSFCSSETLVFTDRLDQLCHSVHGIRCPEVQHLSSSAARWNAEGWAAKGDLFILVLGRQIGTVNTIATGKKI